MDLPFFYNSLFPLDFSTFLWQGTMEEKKEVFLLQNEKTSAKYCQAQLKQLSEPLLKNILRGTFSVPGGYNLYVKEMDKIEHSYNLVPRKGVKAKEVLQSFLQSQAVTKESIFQADKAISACEKALAAEQANKQAVENEQQVIMQKQKMEDQEKISQEIFVQLKKIKTAIERQLRNQERMLKQNMEDLDSLCALDFSNFSPMTISQQ